MTFKEKALIFRYQARRTLDMTLPKLAYEAFHKFLHNTKERLEPH